MYVGNVVADPLFCAPMAVVVNKDNKVQNVTSAHLAKIFKAK